MEAFVLAAGLGTRLKPITDTRPKALVEVAGLSLLERNIDNLVRQGADRIVVNVHHFADMIVDFLQSRTWEAEVVVSDERAQLLDTGGGLRHALSLFSGTQPIVVHNVDILSGTDLRDMLQFHEQNGNAATLAVRQRSTSRQLLFDDGTLVGWRNNQTEEVLWTDAPVANAKEMAFSGISIVEPSLISELSSDENPYPIIPEYLRLAKRFRIGAYDHGRVPWIDVGKHEALRQAEEMILTNTL